ncbi:MAG: spondin domain-containing protein [Solirubrobacteraceae bacterium]
MKRSLLLAISALCGLAILAPAAAASDRGERTWRVTVHNLTPPGPGLPGSQPLSPPLVAVHSTAVEVWRPGTIANHGVAAIAEDANNAPLEQALGALNGVRETFTVPGGPIPSGASREFTVAARGDANRLSLVSMLVNTNDAFTGLHGWRLNGHRATLTAIAYDAGSERNNELAAFIPGPCCGNPFVRDPEGGLIAPHAGIAGVGDLDPALYGWTEPAARITVEPVR